VIPVISFAAALLFVLAARSYVADTARQAARSGTAH
jgi:hypothetical protein